MTAFLELSVETPRGLVDKVAVERVLAGIPTELTSAENSYALTTLLRSFEEKPLLIWRGNQVSDTRWDPRITLAAMGFGITERKMRERLDKHRERYGVDLPPSWALPERQRQGGHCPKCGLEYNHVNARIKKGTTQWVCRPCHNKGRRLAWTAAHRG